MDDTTPSQFLARFHVAAGQNEYLDRVRREGNLDADWTIVGPVYEGASDVPYMEQSEELRDAQMRAEIHRSAARRRLVREYAWAIPNDVALDALAERAPLVEIGAGAGYWSYLLRERGVDVIAYDPRQPAEDNIWCAKRWTGVLPQDHRAVVHHPDRTLFMCWPPYDADWTVEVLDLYKGDVLAFVGESYGCTGTEEFHKRIDPFDGEEDGVDVSEWRKVREVEIPRWYGMRDWLTIFERRP